jgi:formate hydrogenlyase subunit 3/multisubunit Na+/H+ antiporter MnhD subunit
LSLLLLLVPAMPLALAAMLALTPLRPLVAALAPAAPLPALAAASFAPPALDAPWLMLGVRFAIEGPAPAFLFFSGLLWCLGSLAALAYHRDDPRRTGFLACFLLAMAGNLGLLVAGDAFAFYAFFALMSFASYGLVVHVRSAAARRAGRVYIAFVVAGELVLFAGIAFAVASAGSPLLTDIREADLPPAVLAFFLVGFGIKLGLVPLHIWLPLAHAAAPVAASAVLSGAMIKAGLFGLVTFLPLGLAPLPAFGLFLMFAGAAAIPLATVLGGLSPSPKAVLAWSSVGQMGLLAIALGVGLTEPALWALLAPAVLFYAAHHALAKGALFLGVGTVLADRATAWRSATLVALALPAATLAAFPLTGGDAAKGALKAAFDGAPALAVWILPVLAASTAATTFLMTRLFLVLTRQAVVPRPKALALPFLVAAALAVLVLPLWPFSSPGPSSAPSPSTLVLIAAGMATAVLLDQLRGRHAAHPVSVRPASAPAAEPARQRPIAAALVIRLRLAGRRAWGSVTRMPALPGTGATATVVVLAIMLVIEAWTQAGPTTAYTAPGPTQESPP